MSESNEQKATEDQPVAPWLGLETDYIELNLLNYDESEVSQLNAWAIEAATALDATKEQLKAAFRSGYRSGHADTVNGSYQVCERGQDDVADDWFEEEHGG